MGLFNVNEYNNGFRDVEYIYDSDRKYEYSHTTLSVNEVKQMLIMNYPDLTLDIITSYDYWESLNNEESNEDYGISLLSLDEPQEETIEEPVEEPIEETVEETVEEQFEPGEKVNMPSPPEDNSKSQQQDTDDESTDLQFIHPLNPTDPKVIDNLDPINKSKIIADLYNESFNESGNPEDSADTTLNTNGIIYPIILYNSTKLDNNNIISMILDYKGFTPKLLLTIRDSDNFIKFSNTPGINNEIDVIIIFPLDEIYKKISLKFYIKQYETRDSVIYIKADYKNIDMQKKIIGQIGSKKLSTYECLKEIAKTCGMGFAATDECDTVKDEHARLIKNKSYIEYIQEIINYSGTDKDTVFDCFIDVYNYINLINLPWVMNNDVTIKSLGIYSLIGENNTMGLETAKKQPEYVYRMINNGNNFNTINNLTFIEHSLETNIDDIKNNGTLVNYYYVKPYGLGDGCNGIIQNEIQITEKSLDGAHTDEYEFIKAKFMGFEFSETPILMQTSINKSYKLKHNARQLKVLLGEPNLGLQRGQLIGVMMNIEDPIQSQYAINNAANLFGESENIDEQDITDNEKLNEYKKNVNPLNNEMGLDISKTDLYYINGIEYEYIEEYGFLREWLYLVKKGTEASYNNFHTIAHINKTN